MVTALLLVASVAAAQKPPADNWSPLRFLVGSWEGTGKGQPGVSKIQREYRLVLNDKYIQVQNKSTCPDEFMEVFEIAEPGKDFELYSEGHFKRKK